MAANGAVYANKVLNETSLLFLLQHLLEAKLLSKLSDSDKGSIARLINQITHHCCYLRNEEGEDDDDEF